MTTPRTTQGARPPFRRGGRRRRQCFCKENTVDYKDVSSIRRFITDRGRIEPGKKSGNCAKCQRKLTTAIKRARHLALLPFAPDHLRVTGSVASNVRVIDDEEEISEDAEKSEASAKNVNENGAVEVVADDQPEDTAAADSDDDTAADDSSDEPESEKDSDEEAEKADEDPETPETDDDESESKSDAAPEDSVEAEAEEDDSATEAESEEPSEDVSTSEPETETEAEPESEAESETKVEAEAEASADEEDK